MTLPFDAESLRKFYVEDGKTIRELAVLGRCRPERILAAMEAWGIPRRRRGRQRTPLPELDWERLRAIARSSGRAMAQDIARAHGVNREKFDRLMGERLGNRGVLARHVLYQHDGAIREEYERGMGVNELAARYGSSRRAISRSLDRTIPCKGEYGLGGTRETMRT